MDGCVCGGRQTLYLITSTAAPAFDETGRSLSTASFRRIFRPPTRPDGTGSPHCDDERALKVLV
jgi:hypothetical protein